MEASILNRVKNLRRARFFDACQQYLQWRDRIRAADGLSSLRTEGPHLYGVEKGKREGCRKTGIRSAAHLGARKFSKDRFYATNKRAIVSIAAGPMLVYPLPFAPDLSPAFPSRERAGGSSSGTGTHRPPRTVIRFISQISEDCTVESVEHKYHSVWSTEYINSATCTP